MLRIIMKRLLNEITFRKCENVKIPKAKLCQEPSDGAERGELGSVGAAAAAAVREAFLAAAFFLGGALAVCWSWSSAMTTSSTFASSTCICSSSGSGSGSGGSRDFLGRPCARFAAPPRGFIAALAGGRPGPRFGVVAAVGVIGVLGSPASDSAANKDEDGTSDCLFGRPLFFGACGRNCPSGGSSESGWAEVPAVGGTSWSEDATRELDCD